MLQTTQIKQGVSFIVANKVYASTNKTTIVESRQNSFFFFFFFFFSFFTLGGCVSCLRACFGARLLILSYQYPNLSEGADSVGRQLRGNKISDVTKSIRVWRKVPESGARSVAMDLSRHVDVSVHTGSQPTPQSEHRFPAPSSKLCQILLRH